MTKEADMLSVNEYVRDYEFRGDQDYKPSEGEQTMLEDAIEGYLALRPSPDAGYTSANFGRQNLKGPAVDALDAAQDTDEPSPDAGLVDREAWEKAASLIDWDTGLTLDDEVKQLRNAFAALLPTRSVAGEPVAADAGERIRAAAVKLVMAGFMAQKHGLEDEIKKAKRELLWFACDEISRHLERMPTSGRDPATIEACAKVADGLAAKQRATNEKYPDHAKAYATWQNAVFVFEEAAAAIRALAPARPAEASVLPTERE